MPIVLKNPSYFKPFELFTSLLPLPAYTSYDPTPFIGIFFPIFFGMILGDAGYALVLGALALILLKKNRQKGPVRDGAKILLIAAAYSAFFGILFGEFFGDLPERLFHIQPLCMERRTAIVPMLAFSVAVGVAHIILGLILGAINAFKHKIMKEAAYKALSVVIIVMSYGDHHVLVRLFPAEAGASRCSGDPVPHAVPFFRRAACWRRWNSSKASETSFLMSASRRSDSPPCCLRSLRTIWQE